MRDFLEKVRVNQVKGVKFLLRMLSFIGAGGAAPVLWRGTSSVATTLELFLISWARTVGRGERDKDKEKSGKLRSTANCVLERQHSTAATGATDFCLFVA